MMNNKLGDRLDSSAVHNRQYIEREDQIHLFIDPANKKYLRVSGKNLQSGRLEVRVRSFDRNPRFSKVEQFTKTEFKDLIKQLKSIFGNKDFKYSFICN